MSSKNKVYVRICGKDYTIVGFESEEYIQKVAFYLDKKMSETFKTNDKLSTSMAAVLTAINVTDDYFKNLEGLDNLRSQVHEYIKEMDDLGDKLKNKEEENEKLKSSIHDLQMSLVKKETELEDFLSTFDNSSGSNTVRFDNARRIKAK